VTAPAADAREQTKREQQIRKAAEQERKEGKDRDKLLDVLRQTPGGDTERALSKAAGFNPERFGKAMFCLVQEGRAAKCQITKNGRQYDAFRPTGR